MRRQGISPVWWVQALRRRLSVRPPIGEPRLIHRDRELAVAWLPGSSTTLVLVFISIQAKAMRPDRLEFRDVASQGGRNHVLFINDREKTWYSVPGLRDRISEFVRRFSGERGIETIWTIGNSMGGYGAILFCNRLPISQVVAFAPQVHLPKESLVLRIWAKHAKYIRDEVLRDLIPIMAEADCRFHIVTGDSFSDDIRQMAHLRRHLPDAPHVKIMMAPGQRHAVVRWLQDHGQLSNLVTALWAGDRKGLEDCSKALPQQLDLALA